MIENLYSLVKGIDKNLYDFDLLVSSIKDVFVNDGKLNKLYGINPENLPPDPKSEKTLVNAHVYSDQVIVARNNDAGYKPWIGVKESPITEKLRNVVKQIALDHSEKITGSRKKDAEIMLGWVVIIDQGGYVATHSHIPCHGTIALSLHESGKKTITLIDDSSGYKLDHEFDEGKKINVNCSPGDFLIMAGNVNHCVPVLTSADNYPLIIYDFNYH